MSETQTESEVVDLRMRRYAISDDIGERILLRTYQGDASQLHRSVRELELLRDYDRTLAVRGLSAVLERRVRERGSIALADLAEGLDEFLADEVLDEDRPAYEPEFPDAA